MRLRYRLGFMASGLVLAASVYGLIDGAIDLDRAGNKATEINNRSECVEYRGAKSSFEEGLKEDNLARLSPLEFNERFDRYRAAVINQDYIQSDSESQKVLRSEGVSAGVEILLSLFGFIATGFLGAYTRNRSKIFEEEGKFFPDEYQ